VAETASYFLLSELGLGQTQNTDTTTGHALAALTNTTVRTAAYLSSWRELILADPKALFHAFGQAEKAADWVMQRHAQQLEAVAQMAAGIGHDGHAFGRDVGHTMNGGEAPEMTIQTWEGAHKGRGHENRGDSDITGNPWGTPTPAAAGIVHQGGLGGFAGFGMA
jgi:hypothetical protein